MTLVLPRPQALYRRILVILLHWIAQQLGATILPKGWLMFDPELAKAFDNVNTAIIYQKIGAWIESNERRNHNVVNGKAWSYNSYPDWARKEFVWLHPKTVGSHIRKLEQMGRLVSGQLNPNPMKREKWYSSPDSDDGNQMRLWQEQDAPVTTANHGVDSNRDQTKTKAAICKRQSTAKPRARKPVAVGAVASFQKPLENREIPESAPEAAESREANERVDASYQASDIEGTPATVGASRPTPSSAAPPPPLCSFDERILAFWPTATTEPALRALIEAHDEAQAVAVIEYVKTQRCDSPQGLARVLLTQGFNPPGYPPLALPPDEDTADGDVDATHPDELDTEPDGETVTVGEGDSVPAEPETPESRLWKTAYDQMSIQFDQASFDLYLHGATFQGYEAETRTFVIGTSNKYCRDMLQHRLYRDIRRALSDVIGVEVEMRFEIVKPAREKEPERLPLFKLLAREA